MDADAIERMPANTFFRLGPDAPDGLRRVMDERGDIISVHESLYWKGTRTRFGLTRPTRLQVALVVAGPGSGPSGWSALAEIGATGQMPARDQIASLRPVQVEGVEVVLRENLARKALTHLEVACLEALRPGWTERADRSVAECICALAEAGKVRPAVLRSTARGELPAVETALVDAGL